MIMTMLGGFFAAVCADAPPPNASANIAVASKPVFIIDASFHAEPQTLLLPHAAISGPTHGEVPQR
jgi:hypothetical protein